MVQQGLKVGDRVTVNNRYPKYQGGKGTVKFISGGQVWIVFDDLGPVTQGIPTWALDPLP